MANYIAYLCVDPNSYGFEDIRQSLLDFANSHGYSPLNFVEESAGDPTQWRERKLGALLSKAKEGDIFITWNFTTLGSSPKQLFSILEAFAERGLTMLFSENEKKIDGGQYGNVQASTFAMAQEIVVEFLSSKTKEGLQKARTVGRIGGRRKGSTGRLKLDPHREKIGELYALGLTAPKLSKHFGVTEKTMRKFLSRHYPKNT